jgi:hypothetical protein
VNIDVPILRKALEHITAHPEEWDQRRWASKTLCGTSCCLAGTILAQQGYNFVFPEGDWDTEYVTKDDGPTEYIPRVAAEALLGRPIIHWGEYQDVSELWLGSNTLPDLWRKASELTNGEIEIPGEFL